MLRFVLPSLPSSLPSSPLLSPFLYPLPLPPHPSAFPLPHPPPLGTTQSIFDCIHCISTFELLYRDIENFS